MLSLQGQSLVCWAHFQAVSVHCRQCSPHLAPLPLQFEGQTVLIGVDDMDVFKGIELKLLALERVLDRHPEWRGRLTLVQVTNAPRSASWRLPACGRVVHLSWLHPWMRCVSYKVQVISAPGTVLRGPGLHQQGALKSWCSWRTSRSAQK